MAQLTQLALETLRSPVALRNWLVGVAALRLLSVGLGYLAPMTLQYRLYDRASKQFTELTARTSSVWTGVTCLVTLMTAFNVDNRALVATCATTFVAALLYFAGELFVYKTVSVSRVAAPCFFAGGCRAGGRHRHTRPVASAPPTHSCLSPPRFSHVRVVADLSTARYALRRRVAARVAMG